MRWAVWLLLLPLSGCLSGGGGLFGPDEVIPTRWPDLDDATLRPGVQIYFYQGTMASQCTAGFLFASADNATLYLSTTAHCIHLGFEGQVGDAAYSDLRGTRIGTVVYDGWAAGGRSTSDDFLLVALDNGRGIREKAHPAVTALGGPTGLADAQQLPPGTAVEAYGHSGQREAGQSMSGTLILSPPRSPFDPTDATGRTYADMDPHPIQGDSGGPLMTTDGQAVGLLHGGIPVSGSFGFEVDIYTPLAPQIPRAQAAGGDLSGLRLVTWG